MNQSLYRPMFSSVSIGLYCLILTALPACTTSQSNQQRVVRATEHIENPIRAIEARAELELLGPADRIDNELIRSMIPEGLVELTPGSTEFQRALIDPAQVLEHISSPTFTQQSELEDVDPRRVSRAIKLYTQARSLRQIGKGSESIELLKQAARLDPNSGSIQRELGDALITLNDRVGAMSAFARAIELGDRSPRVLVHLASLASNQGDDARVIWLTTQALSDRTITNHPMARSIASVLLGTSQINSGFLKAGCETLEEALDSFDTNSRDLRWKREIIEIMSRRSQLWILIGDSWASIGAHTHAQLAYVKAGEGLDRLPIALVSRKLVWTLRHDQPAGAALVLLDHLEHNSTDLGTQEIIWARSLSSFESISDVLGQAIGELRTRPGLTPSIRQMLLSVELEAHDLTSAITALSEAGLDANDPLVCLRVLDRIENEHDRYRAAVTILESNPSIARALAFGLTRTLNNPIAFMHEHAQPKSPAGELLMASIGIGLGRADLIEHLDTLDQFEGHSVEWISTHIQALTLSGKPSPDSNTDSHMNLLRSPIDQMNAHTNRLLASTMLTNQRPQEAWALAQSLANDSDARIEDLMLGARIAQSLEHFEAAASYLERASELDPYNEKIYEQLFLLRSSSSPIGNEEDLRYIVRSLSSTRPRSSLIGFIRASELVRNGLTNEAELMLVTLNDEQPYQEIGYDLLLSIWKTWSTQDRPEALRDGIAWLEARLSTNPNSIETILKSAQGHTELKNFDRSLELLKDGYARTGLDELGRALERLLAGPLEDQAASDTHLADRLGSRHGIDPTIEYALFLASGSTHESDEQLVELLKEHLPLRSELLHSQRTGLARVVFKLAESIETLNNESVILETISIIEKRTPTLGFQLSRIKVLLLASLPTLDFDRLIGAVNLAVEQSETDEQRDLLRALPIQSLLGEERPHEAIALIARFATLDNELDTEYAIETYRLLAGVGTNSDMIGVLDLLEERGLLEETIELTTKELGTPDRGTTANTIDEQCADLAYTAAALTTAFQRPAQAASYYELSLSYNPDHAWSNNDYGYMLAESGDRMDYAIELLERAARTLPNEASVIDSLAWVRYKMGVFHDIEHDDAQTTDGAISLLMRANELDIERQNATIMLHLGDALWRGGHEERAMNAWIGAEDIARSRIRLIKVQTNPNQNAIEAMSVELREIRYRIQDAESTRSPQISPLADHPSTNTDEEP